MVYNLVRFNKFSKSGTAAGFGRDSEDCTTYNCVFLSRAIKLLTESQMSFKLAHSLLNRQLYPLCLRENSPDSLR